MLVCQCCLKDTDVVGIPLVKHDADELANRLRDCLEQTSHIIDVLMSESGQGHAEE